MPTLLTRSDLCPQDLVVLREFVRFGVLAADQIERRYGDPALASARVRVLHEGGLLLKWRDTLDGARVYSPTRLGEHLAELQVDRRRTNERHLVHDVALVDLADYLLARDPTLGWRTERELRQVLDAIAPPPVHFPGDERHRPDGLLLRGRERIGVELELSDKAELRYHRISRWFAREYRLDGVRWYVDHPRLVERLRQVNETSGFARDIGVEVEPLPPGVTVRRRPDRFEP